MEAFIEQAKVMAKGQITLPAEIRKVLDVKTGDRVVFIVEGEKIILTSASSALKKIQKEMDGEAKKAGINNEEDIIKLLKK